VDVRQRAVLAGQAQVVRAGGCDASGERQRDDDNSARGSPCLPRFCNERWWGTDGRGDSNLPPEMIRRYSDSSPLLLSPRRRACEPTEKPA
jgi:hypothetical protein